MFSSGLTNHKFYSLCSNRRVGVCYSLCCRSRLGFEDSLLGRQSIWEMPWIQFSYLGCVQENHSSLSNICQSMKWISKPRLANICHLIRKNLRCWASGEHLFSNVEKKINPEAVAIFFLGNRLALFCLLVGVIHSKKVVLSTQFHTACMLWSRKIPPIWGEVMCYSLAFPTHLCRHCAHLSSVFFYSAARSILYILSEVYPYQ